MLHFYFSSDSGEGITQSSVYNFKKLPPLSYLHPGSLSILLDLNPSEVDYGPANLVYLVSSWTWRDSLLKWGAEDS